MKPNELRIGNYVNVPHGNIQIDHFIKDGCHFTDGCGGTFASLHPIHLTEEWLEKFGFKNFEKDGFRLKWDEPMEEYSFIIKSMQGCEVDCAGVRYVHQLQNLYFALTGKELEIK